MSNTRNFRISINLCHWFNDHRRIARIFINDDISTIGDLEKRIENIFEIKNFHLTSHNEYLPSSEDVRILQKDDVVWVVQNNYGQGSTPKTALATGSSKENIFKSNKRMISEAKDDIEQDSHPVKKKKKKHKQEESEHVKQSNSSERESKKKKEPKVNGNCITEDEVSSEQVKHKHKKMKKSISNLSDYITSNTLEKEWGTASDSSLNINKLLPVLQSHIDSYNKKNSNKINETASTSNPLDSSSSHFQTNAQSKLQLSNDIKEPYKCKGTLPSYKRRVTVPTITDKYLQEKKINIVKIEYLSGVPPCVKELELSKNKDENQSNLNTTCSYSPKNITNGVNDHSIAITPKIDPICHLESHTDQNITKFEKVVDKPSVEGRERTDDFKLTLIPDKSDISYSKPLNSPKTIENMEICSDETEVHQIKDNTMNNISIGKDEIVDVNKSSLPNSNESLNFDKSVEVMESNQGITAKDSPFQAFLDQFDPKNKEAYNKSRESSRSSLNVRQSPSLSKSDASLISADFCSNEKEAAFEASNDNVTRKIKEVLKYCTDEIIDFKKPKEASKSVVSLNAIDLSSKEIDLSCQSTPETSKNYGEGNVSSEKINESLVNIGSKINNTDLREPDGDVSVCEQSINFEDNSPKKLQLTYTSDLNNSTNKLNENLCSISAKESIENQNENETIINLSDNNKQSDTDLIEDILDTSVSSRGSSSFRRRKQLAGIGQLLGELRGNESLATGESMDSDYSEFVTKRKRKRVRKKKKKDLQDSSLNDSSIIEITDPISKPIRTKARPSLHLKFAEEDGDVKVIDVAKKETGDTESYIDTSTIENITIDSDADQANAESFNIKEEYILKSPSIKFLEPKIGDIIAFKILRMTENYTPEVSSFIIGKVIDFNNKTKIVHYEILNGLEQCKDPKGILSLEEDNKNSDNRNREFAWSDIIDPRLLFP